MPAIVSTLVNTEQPAYTLAMRFKDMFFGKEPTPTEKGQQEISLQLLTDIKHGHPEEFTRTDALAAYATRLGLDDPKKLTQSQEFLVGRLLNRLSKNHDVREIASRYIFPEKKETLH